ncbi:MAG: ComEC family competence protein [Marinilabiliales bacterium]|nr:MAG: ComEC family competence protein [Marinilabiliales bacterium]
MGLPSPLNGLPVFRLLVPFCLGIAVQHHTNLPLAITIPACGLSFILVIVLRITGISRRFGKDFLGGLALVLFMFLFSISLTGKRTQAFSFIDIPYGEGYFVVRVTAPPGERERTTRVIVEPVLYIGNGEVLSVRGRALAWFERDSLTGLLRTGDRVVMANKFNPVRNYGNPFEFDYRGFLQNQGIYGETYVPSGTWFFTSAGGRGGARIYAGKVRERLLGVLREYVTGVNEYAVAGALILGHRQDLDRRLRDSYAASGAMHVLAVSGLHVGIIYMVVQWLLGFMKKTSLLRIARPLIILGVIWSYALITGLSPSVTRAANMFSFVTFAVYLGRKSVIINTLACSALVQLLMNPLELFLAGFQLSYMAVTGIVLCQPAVYSLAKFKNRVADRLWALTAVSLSAQVAIFPLIIYHFNHFPNLFLVTNLFAVPLAILILYSGLAMIAVSFFPYLASAFAIILNLSLMILNFMTSAVSAIPFSQTRDIASGMPGIILLYALLVMLYCFFSSRRWVFIIFAMAIATAGLTLRAATLISRSEQQVFIVYNDNRNSLYGFVSGREKLLVTGDGSQLSALEVPAAASSALSGMGIRTYHVAGNDDLFGMADGILLNNIRVEGGFVSFSGLRIFFADDRYVPAIIPAEPVPIDILIITADFRGNMSDLLELFDPSVVVTDSSNGYFRLKELEGQCIRNGVSIHDVTVAGAFMVYPSEGI